MKKLMNRATHACLMILIVVITSCNKKTPQLIEQPSSLYAQPLTRPLNLELGYTQNPITQDSILPVINAKLDTVVTGQLLPLIGKSKPIAELKGVTLPHQVSTRIIQRAKTVRAKAPVKLTRKKPSKSPKQTRKYVLTSVKQDTLPTGVPFSIKGKKQLLVQAPTVYTNPSVTQKHAQYDIQAWNTQNGSISNTIYTLARSRRGGLWLGTYKGVSYFDGTTFTHYTLKEGLPGENIRGICEDRQGNLWIGFAGEGVGKFDGDSLTLFYDEIPGKHNWSIVEDGRGNIWWASGLGISKYDGRNLTQYTINEGLSANHVNKLLADRQGNIWIGTVRAGLCKLDGASIVHYGAAFGLPETEVAALLEDRQGNIWISYGDMGLVKFDGRHFMHYPQTEGLPGKHILSMEQDLDGNLWLGNHEGLIQFDGKHFRQFAKETGLEGSAVLDMVKDDAGNLWLATYENGLIKCNFRAFQYLHLEDYTAFSALEQDRDGHLWMGIETKGWVKFDGKNYVLYECKDLFEGYLIDAIKHDHQGNLWIGTSRGLIKYAKGKFTLYLSGTPVITLLEDKKGHLWFGTYGGGLFKLTSDQVVHYTQGLFSDGIMALLEDVQGNIWVGSEQGLSKCTDQQVIHYTTREGIPGKAILALFEDHQNQLWIGSYHQGLAHFDGQRFTYYTTKEGLSSNYIQSITEDAQGYVWVATDKGLDCIRRVAGASTQPRASGFPVVSYHQMFRHHLSEFRMNSAAITSDHRLWWGNDKHLVQLQPKHLSNVKKSTRVKLDRVDLGGQVVNYRQLSDSTQQVIRFDSIAKFEILPWGLSLPYGTNQLTFHFHSTSLSTTTQALFSYRVPELNNRWSKPSPKTSITYRNLPAGTFTLELKVLNAKQQWSKATRYMFTIRTPWWQTTWFRLLLVFVGLLLLGSMHQWRVLYLKRKKRQLENAVSSKTAGLVAANRQLNTLNEALRQSKDEIVTLKNKEQALLKQAMEEKERRFLVAVQLFDEKYEKLSVLEKQLCKAIQQKNTSELVVVQDKLQQFNKTIRDLDILTHSIEFKYPQLLTEITTRFPQLSKNEVKHCLLIRLGCSAKEAAQVLEVSVHAVNTARRRLKKKLQLDASVSLSEVLKSS